MTIDAALEFLLKDFSFFGVRVQYWIPASAAFFGLWALYLSIRGRV